MCCSTRDHISLRRILYTALALYIEQVLPVRFRAYGVPKAWYFPCTPRFWRGLCCGKAARSGGIGDDGPLLRNTSIAAVAADSSAPHSSPSSPSIETPDAELRDREAAGRAVAISKLRKEFNTPDGIKVAVDNVSCVFYEGQISVLLGGSRRRCLMLL